MALSPKEHPDLRCADVMAQTLHPRPTDPTIHATTASAPPNPDRADRASVSRVACAVNVDLEWLVHFLADFGFLYWDMRQSVRGNASKTIDLIWRECVSFMHTNESHKTQYAPMAIMRIFWSEALSPALAAIYHRHRTISLLGLPRMQCRLGYADREGELEMRRLGSPDARAHQQVCV